MRDFLDVVAVSSRLPSYAKFRLCLSDQAETPEERNARIEAEWQAEISALSRDAENIARETKSLETTTEEIRADCERIRAETSLLTEDLKQLKVRMETSFVYT